MGQVIVSQIDSFDSVLEFLSVYCMAFFLVSARFYFVVLCRFGFFLIASF